MEELNTSIELYKNIAWLTFGCIAALFTFFRVSVIAMKGFIHIVEKRQQNKWQAEFFDRNHDDYKELRDKYEGLLERVIKIESKQVFNSAEKQTD